MPGVLKDEDVARTGRGHQVGHDVPMLATARSFKSSEVSKPIARSAAAQSFAPRTQPARRLSAAYSSMPTQTARRLPLPDAASAALATAGVKAVDSGGGRRCAGRCLVEQRS